MQLLKTWALACFVVLAACEGSGARERISPVSAPAAAALPQTSHEWVELTPQPIRIGGVMVDPTCSGAPGSNPEFKFWARRGTEDGLVVYFDSGGACWDDVTCSVPMFAREGGRSEGFYKSELMPNDDPRRMEGLFDLNNPRNPVRNWSFVFVPYCTGDVHSGSNDATYHNPDTGAAYTIHHRGADNFRVVLAWMRANFASPDHILVTGSSAGAYGAATHYGRIRDAFPHGQAAMLGDAGQGVTTPDFLERRNGNWRYQLPENVFGANAQLTSDDDIVSTLAAHYPHDRFAQYTTAHDQTQAGFYALMGAQNACTAWTERMVRDLALRQSAPNFRSYLAAGATHTILRSPLFYTEQSGGAPFADWVAELVNGGGLENRDCQNCVAQTQRCRF
jgi:hypothetical protein